MERTSTTIQYKVRNESNGCKGCLVLVAALIAFALGSVAGGPVPGILLALVTAVIGGKVASRPRLVRSSRRISHPGPSKRHLSREINDLNELSGVEFEEYLKHLLERSGWRVRLTPNSADRGIDLIARKRDLKYGIQAKRWQAKVTSKAVYEADFGHRFYKCAQGVVISSSGFTPQAITGATGVDPHVILISGSQLHRLDKILDPNPPKPIATDALGWSAFAVIALSMCGLYVGENRPSKPYSPPTVAVPGSSRGTAAAKPDSQPPTQTAKTSNAEPGAKPGPASEPAAARRTPNQNTRRPTAVPGFPVRYELLEIADPLHALMRIEGRKYRVRVGQLYLVSKGSKQLNFRMQKVDIGQGSVSLWCEGEFATARLRPGR